MSVTASDLDDAITFPNAGPRPEPDPVWVGNQLFEPADEPDDPGVDEEPHLVVVGVKTSGPDDRVHAVVEVAWWDLTTGAHGSFVPEHDAHRVLAQSDLRMLREVRYLDRLFDAPRATHEDLLALTTALRGNVLVEVHPRFDGRFLASLFAAIDPDDVYAIEWVDYLDLGAYGAGVLGLGRAPALPELCERLDIAPGDYTAAGDVAAAGSALSILQGLADRRAPLDPATAVLDAHRAAAAAGGAR